jgi:hypothetical protein
MLPVAIDKVPVRKPPAPPPPPQASVPKDTPPAPAPAITKYSTRPDSSAKKVLAPVAVKV